MAHDPLRRAQRYFLDGHYSKVILLLEPLSLTYRDSHLFHYLLGASCLFTGDVGGAATYLRRAEQLNFRHADTLAALAAVYVRRGDTDKAVQLYLEILEREPENKFAQRALAFLRSISASEKISELTNTDAITALYPKPPVAMRRAVRILVVAVLVIVVAGVVLLVFPKTLRAFKDSRPARTGLEGVELTDQERENPVALAGGFEYVLTEKEAVASFEKAKDLFSTWHDEAALVEINRILLSNAAPSIKTKAETLKSFVRAPDFTSVKEAYSYGDVARDSRLFEGVAVIWKGSAANVREETQGVSFDFLAGYQSRTKLEGIVPAKASFPISITPGAPLEVLGRVRSSGKTFFIEIIAVHELREE